MAVLFDAVAAVVVVVWVDALLPGLLAVACVLDRLFDVGVARGGFAVGLAVGVATLVVLLGIGGVVPGGFELRWILLLALEGACLFGGNQLVGDTRFAGSARFVGGVRLLVLAVFDDLLDAVFQLCCDVLLAARFAAAVVLKSVRAVGGGGESLLVLCLPCAEEGVGRLAGVSLQVVDLGVRDVDVAEVPLGDLDVAWVGLKDVDRGGSRARVGARGGSGGGVLRDLVAGSIELVAGNGMVVLDSPASGFPLCRPVCVESR